MTQILVGTTPVQLPIVGRQSVILQNMSGNDVYVDTAPNVSSSTGYHVALNGGSLTLPALSGRPYYAVASAANSDVRLLILDPSTPRIADSTTP